uniref:Cytochrome c biogenesis protein CcsA n=1 Tax=Jenufa minuta TaxID=993092 RepID=A0A0S2LP13_JENMI|nr:heme attachment to plastid cytochrome c [Jenufa minuta]ALO62938.1 heme attachment to plastid cytochrome c [Jenufa minuta]
MSLNFDIQYVLSNFSFFLLFASMLFYWIQAGFFSTKNWHNYGIVGMSLSSLFLFLLLLYRWISSGHFPLSNLYESLIFLSWSSTMIHLWLENFFKNPFLGCITSSPAFFTNAFAAFSLSPDIQKTSPLVPALQSNWLIMHVTVMILSYAAFISGCLLAIAYLIFTLGKNREPTIYPTELEELSATRVDSMPRKSQSLWHMNIPYDTSELALNLDQLSSRFLGIGFCFLTVGILSGAVWANEAWGSYWSWDPKETWALVTWLVFAIYVHTRFTFGWHGKKSAIIAGLGFLTVWVCYLGVNLIGSGLHSYGWIHS